MDAQSFPSAVLDSSFLSYKATSTTSDQSTEYSMPTPEPTFELIKRQLDADIQAGRTGHREFCDISEDIFHKIQRQQSLTTRRLHCVYNFEQHILRVRMPNEALEDISFQIRSLIDLKLNAEGLMYTACTPTLSPTVRLGNIVLQPDGAWRPRGRKDWTVCAQVGDSESERQLLLDAQRWIEDDGSLFKICLTAKIKRLPEEIEISIIQSAPFYTQILQRNYTSAMLIASAKIIRYHSGPVVEFQDHRNPTNTLTALRLPIVAFTGPQPPTRVQVNLGGDIVLTGQELAEIGRRHWVPEFNY
ncbi:hypothetical protein APSETT444_004478 [Aspergillus pseudonomiae]